MGHIAPANGARPHRASSAEAPPGGYPTAAAVRDAAAAADLRKRRALVVDDAPDVTELLAMVLRFEDFDVVAVFSAPDALEMARAEQFDVVVSDIGMPGMNGYELAQALRGLPEYEAVPLIAVTGFAMYDDRERALASGFDAFLTKPLNPTDLVALIRNL